MATLKNKSWDAIPGHRVEKPAPAHATGKPNEKAAGQILGERVKGKRGPKEPLPRMAEVESTNLHSLTWRPGKDGKGELLVRFLSSGRPVYAYRGVGRDVYDKLLAAHEHGESVGTLFQELVLDNEYPAVKL